MNFKKYILDLFSSQNERTRTVLLTIICWFLLPAPDIGMIFSGGGNIQWLPAVAPLSLVYGVFSLLYQVSRFVMWGYTPGGFDPGFFFEMSALGLLYLGVSLIIADGVLRFKDNKPD